MPVSAPGALIIYKVHSRHAYTVFFQALISRSKLKSILATLLMSSQHLNISIIKLPIFHFIACFLAQESAGALNLIGCAGTCYLVVASS